MDSNLAPAILFGTMLRENSQAARFYDSCVANLPSAAT